MTRVGLTGGVASGKSTVAAILRELGAIVIDADELAREVVAPGSAGLAAVVAEFGTGVLAADGGLDRPAVGAIVFADEERRRALEAIIHPLVRQRSAELEAAAPSGALVVHDIPLLTETGQADRFDAVLVVDAPVEVQVARMLTDRGMTEAEARARIAAQATREQRRAIASHLIDNRGTREELTRQVRRAFAELVGVTAFLDTLPADDRYAIWAGPVAGPSWIRVAETDEFVAASLMKVAVMVAAYRAAEAGQVDLDALVPVGAEFSSIGGGSYRATQDYDNDDEPWAMLGQRASLRWLIRRMIVRSSNLATNIVLDHIGLPTVAETLRELGCHQARVVRGIQDPAVAPGNLVTAADLAAQFAALAQGTAASPAACAEMLEVLTAQEYDDQLRQGLPADVRAAHKTGWVTGIAHDGGLIYPPGAEPWVLIILTQTDLSEAAAAQRVAELAAAAWGDYRRAEGSQQ